MAASTFTSKKCKFDLFISHRGPEVKKTIASSLYYWLAKSHGLKVFVDYQELEGGLITDTQIKEAIASSSLHVVIFSPGYADSQWCLEELHLIIESGKPIIPIFYKVKPDDLRLAQENRGAYAEALKAQEAFHDSTTVGNWRNDLYKAADFTGFDLDTLNGDEGKLMNKVVKCVLKSLKSPNLVDVDKHTFGLDGKAQDFHGQLRALTGKELVARPWRGIEGFNGGIEEFNDLSHATKGIVRISFEATHCKKCNRRAIHLIAAVEGVYSVRVNKKEMKVIVIGSAVEGVYFVTVNKKGMKVTVFGSADAGVYSVTVNKKGMKVSADAGVYSATVNKKEMKVTVIGSADPVCIVGRLRKLCGPCSGKSMLRVDFHPPRSQTSVSPPRNLYHLIHTLY